MTQTQFPGIFILDGAAEIHGIKKSQPETEKDFPPQHTYTVFPTHGSTFPFLVPQNVFSGFPFPIIFQLWKKWKYHAFEIQYFLAGPRKPALGLQSFYMGIRGPPWAPREAPWAPQGDPPWIPRGPPWVPRGVPWASATVLLLFSRALRDI